MDDHALIRKSLSHLLEATEDMQVVATAKNGMEAVAQANRYHPDVSVIDISMPVVDGIGATRQIRADSPVTRVIVLSVYDIPIFIKSALDAGAAGYVLKDQIAKDLITAIRSIHQSLRLPGNLSEIIYW